MNAIATKTWIVAGVVLAGIAAAAALAAGLASEEGATTGRDGLHGTITISGAFALYPLTVRWAGEFRKIHPGVSFDISAGGAGKGIADALGGLVDLGAISRDPAPAEEGRGAYPVVVARDAVVATVNAANPNIGAIRERGLTRDVFARIFLDAATGDWTSLGFAVPGPIHPYTRSDAAGAGETWGKYLGRRQEDIRGTGVFGDPGLLQAVQRDRDGIGYNNIAYVYDPVTHRPIDGIAIVPIDADGNGRIDPAESFYESLDAIVDAIATGRYPSPPARDLAFVSKGRPRRREVVAFLRWVLTDGQKLARPNGYIPLPPERAASALGRVSTDA